MSFAAARNVFFALYQVDDPQSITIVLVTNHCLSSWSQINHCFVMFASRDETKNVSQLQTIQTPFRKLFRKKNFVGESLNFVV